MDFLLPLSEQHPPKALCYCSILPVAKDAPGCSRLSSKDHRDSSDGRRPLADYLFLSLLISVLERRTFSCSYSVSGIVKGPGLAHLYVLTSWLDPSWITEFIFQLKFTENKVLGLLLQFLNLIWESSTSSVEVKVSELLDWNLKGQDFISESCASPERARDWTSETFCLETCWKSTSHVSSGTKHFISRKKVLGQNILSWLLFWGRHGALLLLLHVSGDLISNISLLTDDCDTDAQSEPLGLHIKRALHTGCSFHGTLQI